MADVLTNDEERTAGGKAGLFPLTSFYCRLLKMTNEEVAAADPRRAAKTFLGVSPNVAAEYIQWEQRARGLPVMTWEPVEWENPLAAERKPKRRQSGPGSECYHGVRWPHACPRCESEIIREASPIPVGRRL